MLPAQALASFSYQGAVQQSTLEDVGTRALQSVRVGEQAGKVNAGSGSVLVGYQAGANGTAVASSVLVGYQAGRDAIALTNAVLIGANAGASATGSTETTVVGYRAGEAMRATTQSVGVGAYTLRESAAILSTAVGYRSMERALDAGYNTAVGAESMQNLRSGNFNTAQGYQAMRAAFTCEDCTAVGAYSGYSNATGRGITVIGYKSGENLSESSYVVAVGAGAGQGASNLDGSVLLGANAAAAAASLVQSVVIGADAAAATGGASNVVVGAGALPSAVAFATVALGPGVAANLASGSNNVFVGPGADAFVPAVDDAIAIGAASTLANSQSISIGRDIQNERFASVLVGAALQSDTDNSVLVGNHMSIKSVIFFKDPLLASFTNAVTGDALNKIGACNISYGDLLLAANTSAVFDVAQAGYLTSNVFNNLTMPVDAGVSPTGPDGFDLRCHAPDGAYVLPTGLVVPFAENAAAACNLAGLLTRVVASNVDIVANVAGGLPSANAAAFKEDWSLPLVYQREGASALATTNVWGLGTSTATFPYFVTKRAALPLAPTGAGGAHALSNAAASYLPPAATWAGVAPAAGDRLDALATPTTVFTKYIASNVPITGTWAAATGFTPAPEALFAAAHAPFYIAPSLQIRAGDAVAAPVGLVGNAWTPITLAPAASNALVYTPNALSAADVAAPGGFRLTRDLLAVTPPAPTMPVRLTHLDSNLRFSYNTSNYTAADVAAMEAAGIADYPDALRTPLLATAAATFNAAALSNVVGTAALTATPLANLQTEIDTYPTPATPTEADTLAAVATDLADLTARLAPAAAVAPTVAGLTATRAAFYATSNAAIALFAAYLPEATPYVQIQFDTIESYVYGPPDNDAILSDVLALLPGIAAGTQGYAAERQQLLGTDLPALASAPGGAQRAAFIQTTSNAFDLYETWWEKYIATPRLFLTYADVLAGTGRFSAAEGAEALTATSWDAIGLRVGACNASVTLAAALPTAPLWCNVEPLPPAVVAAASPVLTALALPAPWGTAGAAIDLYEPFQYGSVTGSSYIPGHPWQNDDGTGLATRAGQSQVVRAHIERAPAFHTLQYAPLRYPSVASPPAVADVLRATDPPITQALSNLTLTLTSNVADGVLGATTAALNGTPILGYDPDFGLPSTTSNLVTSTLTQIIGPSSVPGSNVLVVDYTRSWCNVAYGLGGVLATPPSYVVEPTVTATTSNPAPSGSPGIQTLVTSNAAWTVTTYRTLVYNSNIDVWEGTSNVHDYLTLDKGENHFVYKTKAYVAYAPAAVRSNVAATTPAPGATTIATVVRRRYDTSNVTHTEAYVPWTPTAYWTEPLTAVEKSNVVLSVSGAAGVFVASNVGPVGAWSNAAPMYVSLPALAASGAVQVTASGPVAATRALAWTPVDVSAAAAALPPLTTANATTLIFDSLFHAPVQGALAAAAAIAGAGTWTAAHWLDTGAGRIVGAGAVVTSLALSAAPAAYYTPNAPSWQDLQGNKTDEWLVYFTAPTTGPPAVSRVVRVPLVWAAADTHTGAHVVNTGLARFATGALTPRRLHPPVAGIHVVSVSAGWTLRGPAGPVDPSPQVPVDFLYSDIVGGSWSLTPTAAGPVVADGQLTYTIVGAAPEEPVRVLPLRAFAHDAFPTPAAMAASTWTLQEIGLAPRTSVLAGTAFDGLYHMYERTGSVASNAIGVEVVGEAGGMFLEGNATGGSNVRRTTLAGLSNLRRIPFEPMALSNEKIDVRFVYGAGAAARASPIVGLGLSNYVARLPPGVADPTRTSNIGRALDARDGLWVSPGLVQDGYGWLPSNVTLAYDVTGTDATVTMTLGRAAGGPALVTAPRTFVATPASAPATWNREALALACDQADSTDLAALAACVDYRPDRVRDVVFYVSLVPNHGILVKKSNGESVVRFTLAEAVAGDVVYQHLGGDGAALADAFALRVGTGAYDVGTPVLTFAVTVRPLPRVLVNRRHYLYESTSNAAATLRAFSASNLHVSDTGYLHVLATNGLALAAADFTTAALAAGATTARFAVAPAALTGSAPYPPLSFTFAANATATPGYVNDLAALPAYRPLFVQTYQARLNAFECSNVLQAGTQPADDQVLEYTFLPEAGVDKFKDHAVGVFVEVMPTQPFMGNEAGLEALRDFRAVLEAIGAGETVLFRITMTKETVVYEASNLAAPLTRPIPPALRLAFDAFNGIYFLNIDRNNGNKASLYLKYSLKDVQSVNASQNLFFGLDVPAVPLDTIARLRWSTDLADATMTRTTGVVAGTGTGGLATSYDLTNYHTTLKLRNFEVLISTYTTSFAATGAAASPYDATTYNIAGGKDIQVLGVRNIAFGSNFTTSGQSSIIIGNNIGTTLDDGGGTNEIYESIVIGNECFANAFVRDVIAIGTNNMNDLYLSATADVNAFLARQPVIVGNNITREKLDFHINVGNAFLKTAVGGEQIYLGTGGEAVGVGFASNAAIGAAYPGARLVVNGGAVVRQEAVGAGLVDGDVVSLIEDWEDGLPVVGLAGAADSNVFGVWSGGGVVVSGRVRIKVSGSVARGDLLCASATAGVAAAQVGANATTWTSATIGKAVNGGVAGVCWAMVGR